MCVYMCVFTRTDMLEPLLVVCDTLFSQSLSLSCRHICGGFSQTYNWGGPPCICTDM